MGKEACMCGNRIRNLASARLSLELPSRPSLCATPFPHPPSLPPPPSPLDCLLKEGTAANDLLLRPQAVSVSPGERARLQLTSIMQKLQAPDPSDQTQRLRFLPTVLSPDHILTQSWGS